MICDLSGDGEIKLCSGAALCPATPPGQSSPRLPTHTLGLGPSEGCDLMAPESWAVSNPDSSLAACSGWGGGNGCAAVKSTIGDLKYKHIKTIQGCDIVGCWVKQQLRPLPGVTAPAPHREEDRETRSRG